MRVIKFTLYELSPFSFISSLKAIYNALRKKKIVSCHIPVNHLILLVHSVLMHSAIFLQQCNEEVSLCYLQSWSRCSFSFSQDQLSTVTFWIETLFYYVHCICSHIHMCICRYTLSLVKGTVGSINISPWERKSNKTLIWGKQLFLPGFPVNFHYLLGRKEKKKIKHTQMASKLVQEFSNMPSRKTAWAMCWFVQILCIHFLKTNTWITWVQSSAMIITSEESSMK